MTSYVHGAEEASAHDGQSVQNLMILIKEDVQRTERKDDSSSMRLLFRSLQPAVTLSQDTFLHVVFRQRELFSV